MKKQNQSQERLCEDCGEKIPKGRILARPTATLCVHCQERFEDRGHFQRHRMDYVVTASRGEAVETMETVMHAGTAV